MNFTVSMSAMRDKKGNDWVAYFFKHKNNTVMVEDMWSKIDEKSSFEQVQKDLKEMQKGYEGIKVTVDVFNPFPDLFEVVRRGNTLPSITVKKV